MRILIGMFIAFISVIAIANGSEAPAPSGFDKFMAEYGVMIATVAIMVIESLIGFSKIKSNSIIEFVLRLLRVIKEDKK